MMRRVLLLCLVGLVVVGCRRLGPKFDAREPVGEKPSVLTNLVTAGVNPIQPDWLRPGTNAFTLGPGDRLEIEILGETQTRTTTFVGPDGKIYFNFLPGIDVLGLTLAQTKAVLEENLAKAIRTEPKVALSLKTVESKRVWLLGRLNKPGLYPLAGQMTLLEAIAQAGGPTTPTTVAALGGGVSVSFASGGDEVADLERSFVIRGGQVLPLNFSKLLREGDMSQNIYLEPDDLIYLPSAAGREVFVLGAVGAPQAVPYTEGMTLVSAIASAGGTIKDAYLSHVAIVRGSPSSPQIAVVDFKDVVRGRQTDVLVQPHDIVYVPFTPYQVLSRYLDLILNTFGRAMGANAGALAVDPNASPLTPDVPISFR
jgi:polysaccharide biosynthesis/export protein